MEMLKKTIILFLLCSFICSKQSALCQSIDLNKPLTKEQMYKDFDEFVQIIDNGSQTLVREISTGYDMAEEIRRKRLEIDTIRSHRDFLYFLNTCLNYTMGVHSRWSSSHRYLLGEKDIDTLMIKVIDDLLMEDYTPTMHTARSLGLGFYYNGNYFVFGDYTFIHKRTKERTTVSDFRILEWNHKPVDFFQNKLIESFEPFSNRWDYRTNKDYNISGLKIPFKGNNIFAEDYKTKKQFFIDLDSSNVFISSVSLPEEEKMILGKKMENSERKKIAYYDSLNLLYIYLGTMHEDGGTFTNSVKEVGRNKNIDKIVIDIRGNGGGSDIAFHYLLAAIIKNPISSRCLLGIRDNAIMKRIIDDVVEQRKLPQQYISKKTIPFLDNTEFVVISAYDGLVNEDMNILPDSNSLGYDGTIYLLVDEHIFSSAGSLASLAKHTPQLISVGVPTGLIGGYGFNPAIFQLPESKFTFQMDITVDLAEANTVFDIWHDLPEIEIYPTFDEIIEMNNYGMYLNKRGDRFLFNHDYLFKKVLEY